MPSCSPAMPGWYHRPRRLDDIISLAWPNSGSTRHPSLYLARGQPRRSQSAPRRKRGFAGADPFYKHSETIDGSLRDAGRRSDFYSWATKSGPLVSARLPDLPRPCSASSSDKKRGRHWSCRPVAVIGSTRSPPNCCALDNDLEVLTVALCLAERATPDRLLAATIARFGGLDILINNAGLKLPTLFGELTSQLLRLGARQKGWADPNRRC